MRVVCVGKAASAQVGKAKSGNFQVIVEFYVTRGKYKDNVLLYYGALSGGATRITMEQLGYCGCSDLTKLADVKKNTVRLTIEEEDGKSPTVRYINPMERDLAKEPATAAEIKSLQTMVEAELKGHDKGRQREPGDDDDVPFPGEES